MGVGMDCTAVTTYTYIPATNSEAQILKAIHSFHQTKNRPPRGDLGTNLVMTGLGSAEKCEIYGASSCPLKVPEGTQMLPPTPHWEELQIDRMPSH